MRFTKAADIMTDSVISLKPEMTLQQAWDSFFENRISGAPVIDRNDNVVGVLSQSDLLREMYAVRFADATVESFYFDIPFCVGVGDTARESNRLKERTVADTMTADPICVQLSDSVSFLARTMRERHIHRLIVTEGKKLRGIVSSFDLLKVMTLNSSVSTA